MPDLIALSRSLYALSQNKNDPNTNPEIMSCSRKDIFVDISWVTAKKNFFRPFILSKFCYKHSQNCSGVIRNDQNMTHQPSTALGGRKLPTRLWPGQQPPLPPHLGDTHRHWHGSCSPGTYIAFCKGRRKQQYVFYQRSKKTTLKPASRFMSTIAI